MGKYFFTVTFLAIEKCPQRYSYRIILVLWTLSRYSTRKEEEEAIEMMTATANAARSQFHQQYFRLLKVPKSRTILIIQISSYVWNNFLAFGHSNCINLLLKLSADVTKTRLAKNMTMEKMGKANRGVLGRLLPLSHPRLAMEQVKVIKLLFLML